jgi:hypothetical protein
VRTVPQLSGAVTLSHDFPRRWQKVALVSAEQAEAHLRPWHRPVWQSLASSQRCPTLHWRGQLPPQSTSLSIESTTPLSQMGTLGVSVLVSLFELAPLPASELSAAHARAPPHSTVAAIISTTSLRILIVIPPITMSLHGE